MLYAYFFQFPCFSMRLRHWGQCRQGIEVNAAKALRSMLPRHWGQCRQGIEVNFIKALRSMPSRHWGQCHQGMEVITDKALRSMPTWCWGQCRHGIEFNAYINIHSKPTINMSTEKWKLLLSSPVQRTWRTSKQVPSNVKTESYIYFCFPRDCLCVQSADNYSCI